MKQIQPVVFPLNLGTATILNCVGSDNFGALNIEDDKFGLNYIEFIAPIIKAIQELKAENDSLKEILQRNNIN